MSYIEMADVIERFVNGNVDPWEWEEYFLATKYSDPFLSHVQKRVLAVSFEFPAGAEGGYANSQGLVVRRKLANQLRS